MIGNKIVACTSSKFKVKLQSFKGLAHWVIRHRLDNLLRILFSIYPLIIASLDTGHTLVQKLPFANAQTYGQAHDRTPAQNFKISPVNQLTTHSPAFRDDDHNHHVQTPPLLHHHTAGPSTRLRHRPRSPSDTPISIFPPLAPRSNPPIHMRKIPRNSPTASDPLRIPHHPNLRFPIPRLLTGRGAPVPSPRKGSNARGAELA